MKHTALVLGTLLAFASTGYAYQTDDFGFPTTSSFARANDCPPTTVRSALSFRYTPVLRSIGLTVSQPAPTAVRVVAQRPITSRVVVESRAITQPTPTQPAVAIRPTAAVLR